MSKVDEEIEQLKIKLAALEEARKQELEASKSWKPMSQGFAVTLGGLVCDGGHPSGGSPIAERAKYFENREVAQKVDAQVTKMYKMYNYLLQKWPNYFDGNLQNYDHYVCRNTDGVWEYHSVDDDYYPEVVRMSLEMAKEMAEDLNSGRFNLD